MFNDVLNYHLNSNVEQGFFFFDLSPLDEIKQVELTFCDCPTDSTLLEIAKDFFEGIIDNNFEVTPQQMEKFGKDIVKTLPHSIKTEIVKKRIKEYIKKKINQKVGHAIAKTALKKSTKKEVGSFWGKVFFPEVFEAAEAAERKYESYAYINKKIIFDITNNYYKKTIGFSVHFPSEDVIEVYELFLDNNKRSYRLIQKS